MEDNQDRYQEAGPNVQEEEVSDENRDNTPDAYQDFSFLENFTIIRIANPRKGDIIYYFYLSIMDWTRVRIISKSNYRYYYNIRFINYERPDAGIYLRPGEVWSHDQPIPYYQKFQEDHPDDGEDSLPPPELERQHLDANYHLLEPQISLIVEQAGSSRIRKDRVYTLPEDDLRGHLSPRLKKKAARINLHPAQEYMRSAIAKYLAPESKTTKP